MPAPYLPTTDTSATTDFILAPATTGASRTNGHPQQRITGPATTGVRDNGQRYHRRADSLIKLARHVKAHFITFTIAISLRIMLTLFDN
ncbi:hypothetical protein Zmor_020731 [Zophobas morio]|uniref:Uncharacterized protein n=1 Tax=Zophobas morio TaxID=2755281 RepID=A0AA38MAA1_9CUCU|nr:hypothetical protein Zmor_020731 [Zophobas morio]